MNCEKMINETLRLIRVAHGLKGKEVADKLGVSASYISEIESGKKTPPLDLLLKYSQLFDVHLSTLVFFAEELDRRTSLDKIKVNFREWIFSLICLIDKEKKEESYGEASN
jgi:transcriptional regulator with XRE-family HTH domain